MIKRLSLILVVAMHVFVCVVCCLGTAYLARLNLNFLKTIRLNKRANDYSTMQLIRIFSSPRDSSLHRFLIQDERNNYFEKGLGDYKRKQFV